MQIGSGVVLPAWFPKQFNRSEVRNEVRLLIPGSHSVGIDCRTRISDTGDALSVWCRSAVSGHNDLSWRLRLSSGAMGKISRTISDPDNLRTGKIIGFYQA
jgi:hypothetical protein